MSDVAQDEHDDDNFLRKAHEAVEYGPASAVDEVAFCADNTCGACKIASSGDDGLHVEQFAITGCVKNRRVLNCQRATSSGNLNIGQDAFAGGKDDSGKRRVGRWHNGRRGEKVVGGKVPLIPVCCA